MNRCILLNSSQTFKILKLFLKFSLTQIFSAYGHTSLTYNRNIYFHLCETGAVWRQHVLIARENITRRQLREEVIKNFIISNFKISPNLSPSTASLTHMFFSTKTFSQDCWHMMMIYWDVVVRELRTGPEKNRCSYAGTGWCVICKILNTDFKFWNRFENSQ